MRILVIYLKLLYAKFGYLFYHPDVALVAVTGAVTGAVTYSVAFNDISLILRSITVI